MKLEHFAEDYHGDDSNPEYDEYVRKEIQSNFYSTEELSEGGLVPLDPFSYDAASATQENISEWFNVLVVNDTENDNYAEALNRIQTPIVQYFTAHGEDYVHHEAGAQLKALADGLGDRFTFSQLESVNRQWVEVAGKATSSYEDIANNDDLGQSYADDRDERKDPYGFRGVSRSDFI